jgi:hypothetical protein
MMSARNSEALPPSHGEHCETPGKAGGCRLFRGGKSRSLVASQFTAALRNPRQSRGLHAFSRRKYPLPNPPPKGEGVLKLLLGNLNDDGGHIIL